jgi:hypothetical protein
MGNHCLRSYRPLFECCLMFLLVAHVKVSVVAEWAWCAPPRVKVDTKRLDEFLAYCAQREAEFEQGMQVELSEIDRNLDGRQRSYTIYACRDGELVIESSDESTSVSVRNPESEFTVSKPGAEAAWQLGLIRDNDPNQFPLHFQHLRRIKAPWCLDMMPVHRVVSRPYVTVNGITHDEQTGLTTLEIECDRPASIKESLGEQLPFLHPRATADISFEGSTANGFRIVKVVLRHVLPGQTDFSGPVTITIDYEADDRFHYSSWREGRVALNAEVRAEFRSRPDLERQMQLPYYGINVPTEEGNSASFTPVWAVLLAIVLFVIAWFVRSKSESRHRNSS